MDWKAIAEDWKPFRNEVRSQWALLTEAQLDSINGQRTLLAEQIRHSYGMTADEVEDQILNFEARNQFLRGVSSR
jgi:uncharacterized protein YjbJ (UPF0337 family)